MIDIIKYFVIEEGFFVLNGIAYWKKKKTAEMFFNLQEQFKIFKGIKLHNEEFNNERCGNI